MRLSHKIYRPSPTRDVTWKDPPLRRGPLIGVNIVLAFSGCVSMGHLIGLCLNARLIRASPEERDIIDNPLFAIGLLIIVLAKCQRGTSVE
jgi:hypothetical protein